MALSSDEQKRARQKAMRLLERMDRTEKGLIQKLKDNGFQEEAIADALAYVKSFGYINDARYASSYITGRLGSKSRQQIFMELRQKGVDEETILSSWEESTEFDSPDERSQIRALIEKKYPDLIDRQQITEKEQRRLYGYLMRRGYSMNDIRHVLSDL